MNKSALPFAIPGGVSIVLGGVVSAASAGAPSYLSAWAVAYLVLVCGVAQLVLGMGQASLASKQPTTPLLTVQSVALNLSNAAVLLGTLVGVPVLSYVGAALLVFALGLFIRGVRGVQGTRVQNAWLLWGFRIVVFILLVSAPIGLVISHLRAA
ncbi:hypothetical protein [Arthrobacter sp.]|uniref:hypothetical protein n=1 Tax=Arthrobacter sp. TaxID=1667 RepID=UPI0026DFC7EA|nr:hypothetical protein [Arthrobacter sp.]MDO5753961.1 hypothetical protein [Arthrobacter sp.]